VRIAHLPDSSLTAVRVGQMRRVVCAAPGYLERRGTPRRLDELREHDAIVFSQTEAADEWAFGAGSAGETVRPPAKLIVNSSEVAIAAAVAGRGITRVLSYQAAAEVRAGRLAIVLDEFEPPAIPISVVYPEGRRAAAKVRAFVDFAVARLRADAALN
jgi:DNA-binding transcriptional LysR family regulator